MLLATLVLLVSPQSSDAKPAGEQPPKPAATGVPGVPFDERGWPVVDERPAPDRVAAAPRDERPAPGGTSPFPAMFESLGTPRDLAALGTVTAWWRLTVHGPQGESIGIRELTHLADLRAPDRDRIDYGDGRVAGRSGATVFAQRFGTPWPTLLEPARAELELLGMHLRAPWLFTDERRFAVTDTQPAKDAQLPLARVWLMRRPADAPVEGPALVPPIVDRFELLCPAAAGPPAELVHQFASSGARRRIRFEDWRAVGGVKVAFRRVYVDDGGRPTTTLELLRVESTPSASDRDFRLQ